MRLLSPWALAGLIALAGPILAHLLARRPPQRLRFPNLRFLPLTPPTPVKRHRLADSGLLALRVAVLALAAIAFAQPQFTGSAGSAGSTGSIGPAGLPETAGAPRSVAPARELTLLVGEAERGGAEASLSAAVRQGAPARVAGGREIAMVFPQFEDRAALTKSAAPLSQPWMSDVFTAVATDPQVAAAAERAGRRPLDILHASSSADTTGRLLVFIDAPAHSLIAAAAISATLHSASSVAASKPEAPIAADAAGPQADLEDSDARWVWIIVALLLLVETAVRRRRPLPEQDSVERARVA
jgi:hypothetical protein